MLNRWTALYPSQHAFMQGGEAGDDDRLWEAWQLLQIRQAWPTPARGGLCIALELCHDCHLHAFSTSHDEQVYREKHAALFQQARPY